jgi:hypothetical protein
MFERSLNDKESGLYLGDIKVVDKLVGEFIDTIATNTDINVVYRTITRYSTIFLGMNEDYKVIPDWNDKEHLGLDLAKRLSVAYVVFSVDVFRSAFGVFAREVLQLVKESASKSDQDDYTDVMKLKTYMVSVLLGTAGTLYPNNKGWR